MNSLSNILEKIVKDEEEMIENEDIIEKVKPKKVKMIIPDTDEHKEEPKKKRKPRKPRKPKTQRKVNIDNKIKRELKKRKDFILKNNSYPVKIPITETNKHKVEYIKNRLSLCKDEIKIKTYELALSKYILLD